MSLDEAEGLLHAMAREFGGDPAATDTTRVLRVPGFANKKYGSDFYVEVRKGSTEISHLRDFKLHIDSQDSPRHNYHERAKRELSSRNSLSQSEHDGPFRSARSPAAKTLKQSFATLRNIGRRTKRILNITRGSP